MFGREPVLGFVFDKLSEAEKERAICYNADLLIEVAETLGHCAIRCIPGYWEVAPDDPAYLWIFKGIPAENYQAMVDARRKYGRL